MTDTVEPKLPTTVQEAVSEILEPLSLNEKVRIANMSEKQLAPLKLAMRVYVQNRLEESGVNEELKNDCVRIAGKDLDEVEASTVIIDEVWKELKEGHRLRVVN